MKLGGADSDLGAQAQLKPVVEAGGGIDQNGGRGNLPEEPLGIGVILGNDGFRVGGAIADDVLNGLVQVLHDPHCQDQVQVLGRPVFFRGFLDAVQNPPG